MAIEQNPGGQTPKETRYSVAEGFENINHTFRELNLLERLHAEFSQRGVETTYLSFDGVEISAGFPVPVNTRYVVPVFPGGLGAGIPDEYPGVAVAEIHGLGVHTLAVQIGLNKSEMKKVAMRARAHANPGAIQTDWAPTDIPVQDVTTPHSLDFLAFDELLEAYIYTGLDSGQNVTEFTYEQERPGGEPQTWPSDLDPAVVDTAFALMGELIDGLSSPRQ